MQIVRWAPQALADTIRIWRYILADSPQAAHRVLGDIDAVVGVIAFAPKVGSPLSNGDRKMSVRRFPYLIRYRVRRDEIEIKRVHHMSQNWNP